MIDLVMYGTRADLRAFLEEHGLITIDGGEVVTSPQFDYCEWAGSGKFMTSAPKLDERGGVVSPATFLPAFVILARVRASGDVIADGAEQWQRSKLARRIKNNGAPGTMGGIPYYELKGVRMLRADDVFSWLASRGLPAHEWAGGNVL